MSVLNRFSLVCLLLSLMFCMGALADDAKPVDVATKPAAADNDAAATKKAATKLFTDGLMMMNHHSYDRAEESFIEALKLEPDSYNTRIYLAKCYLSEKKKKNLQALERYREAIKIDPKKPVAYDGLISVYINLLLYKDAVNAGNEALKNGVPKESIAGSLGWALYIFGDYDKAVEQFRIVREAMPLDAVSYNNEGLARFAQERYEDALALFKQAGEKNPESELVPYFSALTYMKLGREADAMDSLRAGMKLTPDYQTHLVKYDREFFPIKPPGDLDPLFDKIKAADEAKNKAPAQKPEEKPEAVKN